MAVCCHSTSSHRSPLCSPPYVSHLSYSLRRRTAANKSLIAVFLGINAYAYMVGARIVHFSLPDRRVFRTKASYMTRLFVGADLVCFGVQGAGGSMLSGQGSASSMQTGKVLYTAGFIVQLIFIAVFTEVVVQLHVRVRKNPPSAWNANSLQLIWVTFIVLILIFVSTSGSVLKGRGLTHV